MQELRKVGHLWRLCFQAWIDLPPTTNNLYWDLVVPTRRKKAT